MALSSLPVELMQHHCCQQRSNAIEQLPGGIARPQHISSSFAAPEQGLCTQIHVTTHTEISGDLRELVDYIYPSAGYVVVDGQRR